MIGSQDVMAEGLSQAALRELAMPDTEAARQQLLSARFRLFELGWRSMAVAPKDGAPVEAIDSDYLTVFKCFFAVDGSPESGSWVRLVDGIRDVVHPVLYRLLKD